MSAGKWFSSHIPGEIPNMQSKIPVREEIGKLYLKPALFVMGCSLRKQAKGKDFYAHLLHFDLRLSEIHITFLAKT